MPIERGRPVKAEVSIGAEFEDEPGSTYAVDGELEEGIATFGDLFAAVDPRLQRLGLFDKALAPC